jgi:methylglutaconyl-CoA hydratase
MPNPITDPLVENVIVDDIGSVVKLESTPEGVATVTLSRPDQRNAFDTLMIEGLTEAFRTLKTQDHIRVVFVRGEGGNFCAGGDPEWLAQAVELIDESDNRADAMSEAVMIKALHDIPAVTVALVEGAAEGGGLGLIAACDFAVAVQGAQFACAEVRRGLTPAIAAPYLVDAIGPSAARALFVTGRAIDAEHALKLGLVHQVVADAAGLEQARASLVEDAMAAAPGAVAEARQLVWDVWGRPIDHGMLEETSKRAARRRVSEEGREAVKAASEQRKPGWAG